MHVCRLNINYIGAQGGEHLFFKNPIHFTEAHLNM